MVILLFVNLGITEENTGSAIFHIETKDGNGYTGVVVESDSDKVVFKADKLGVLTIGS